MFNKNKISFVFFFIIILIFSVGGFFLMRYALDYEYSNNDVSAITQITDNRLDKTKDYVYFTNVVYPITGSVITYADICINLNGFEYLTDELNESEKLLQENIVYVSEVNFNEEDALYSNDEGIYSVEYREYSLAEYEDFLTIIIADYEYNILGEVTLINLENHIIDKLKNEIVSKEEVLIDYEYSEDEIYTKVKEVLESKVYSGEDILVNDTMDNFSYVVYPNKVGSLEILYEVTSTNYIFYDKLVIN